MIDWASFLRRHNIDFVEQGPSTAKGNVYVKCVWCKDSENYYLGIHLCRGKRWEGYGCWRDQRHRGRDPRKLVGALLGIGLSEANRLLKLDGDAPGFVYGTISDRVAKMKSVDEVDDFKLKFPPEIKPIQNDAQSRIFISYLEERGFSEDEAIEACYRYKLRYAMKGPFSYRLIFPIRDEYELVTWTGRSVVEDEEVRYRTLSSDPEKAEAENLPRAMGPITYFLWNEREIVKGNGNGLIVCEGPIDAIKLDYYCRESLGVWGTCLFGKTISNEQVYTLHQVAPYYGKKFILLDKDAGLVGRKLLTRLYHWGYRFLGMPRGKYKDVGAMPKDKLLDFIEKSVQLAK